MEKIDPVSKQGSPQGLAHQAHGKNTSAKAHAPTADGSKSPKGPFPAQGKPLPLPHERDESTSSTAEEPRDVICQAAIDLKRGLVDTDMRATPGLDSTRREALLAQTLPKAARKQAK